MNTRTRKIILTLIVAVLSIAVLAGCTPAPTATTAAPTATAAPTPDPLATKETISVAYWGIDGSFADTVNAPSKAVRDAFLAKLNIAIVPVNTTWDDYTSKIQLWATSGELPDVFAIDAIGTQMYKDWITQGIVKEIPSDLSAYPALGAILGDANYGAYKYPMGAADAKFYNIPRPNYLDATWWANDYAVILRKDWMANLGASMPTNMEEFTALMVKFATLDPDKNGKNDTIGLSCYNASWLGILMNAYEPGLTAGKSLWVRDAANAGKWIPSFMTQGAKDGWIAVKALYDAGGLDKDFATYTGSEGLDKFINGVSGAYAHGGNLGSTSGIWGPYLKIHADAKWADTFVIMPPFKNYKDGNVYYDVEDPAWSESYINASVSDSKMDRILRMFDFFFSTEGYRLTHFGIEGKDYTVSGDKITLTPQKDTAGVAMPASFMGSFAQWSGTGAYINPSIYQDLADASKAALDVWLTTGKAFNSDIRMEKIDYASKVKAVENFKEDTIKLVLSSDFEADYAKLIADYKASGYDAVVADANAEAAKLGLK